MLRRHGGWWTVCLVVLAIVVAIGLLAPIGAAGAEESEPAPADPSVTIDIDVDEHGDAEWAIEYRFDLSNESAEEVFDDLASSVQAGEVSLPLDEAAMEAFLTEANSANAREMSIDNTRWTAVTEDGVGILALEFTWHQFADRDGDELEVGSAFHASEGTWFGTLSDGMRLAIHGPDGEAPSSVPPEATVDNGTVVWDGPQTFDTGDIDLRYQTPTSTGMTTASWVALAAIILIGLTGIVMAYRRGWRPSVLQSPATDETPEKPTDAIDETLLSDPERVERLLRENSGRMKQAAIVEETGWSSAKVSQLLSEMADDGRIEKLRIGQENLISLPDLDDEESG